MRLVVSLGGSNGIVLDAVLEGVAGVRHSICVDVVVSTSDQAVAIQKCGFSMHVALSAEAMADLVAMADIAIGAGGISLLERCCIGLPSIVATVAANQRSGTEATARRGACHDLGPIESISATAVTQAVTGLIEDVGAWHRMSYASAQITDGLGAARLAARLDCAAADRDGNPIALRRADPSDSDRMLMWQRHPATRQYARNSKAPLEDEHAAWFDDQLGRGTCIFNVILADEEPVGVLRLERVVNGRQGYEVSILVDPARHGRGIAGAALKQAPYLAGDAPLWAYIADDNSASRELFRTAGYRPAADGWYVAAR